MQQQQLQQFHTPDDDRLSAEDAIAIIQAVSTLSTALAARTIFNNSKLRSLLGSLFAAKFVEVSRIDTAGSSSGCRGDSGGGLHVHGEQQAGSSSRSSASGPAAQAVQMIHSSIRSLLPAPRRKQRHPTRPETTWVSTSDEDGDDAVPHSMSSGSPGANATAAATTTDALEHRRLYDAPASTRESRQPHAIQLRTVPFAASSSSTATAGIQQHIPAGCSPRTGQAIADARNVITPIAEVHGSSDAHNIEASPQSSRGRFAHVLTQQGVCTPAAAVIHTAAAADSDVWSSRKGMIAVDPPDALLPLRGRASSDELATSSPAAAAARSPGEGEGFAASVTMAAATALSIGGSSGVALVCELCGRRFSKQSALMQHRRWHTGEKPVQPYSCEQCGRGFSSRNSLHIHRAIHSGEKRYACEVCGKRFSTQTYLWHHRAVHSDARPFSCEYCACDFKMRSSLNNHLARRHAVFSGPANSSVRSVHDGGSNNADSKPAGSPAGGADSGIPTTSATAPMDVSTAGVSCDGAGADDMT